ncbi:MAG: hypothetical protein K2I85_02370 [Alistipes sp.]|nr:hypothetical protein [Alistipes sp.]MDE6712054.1 hypothetical protein [Alistipes sp.]
MGRKFKLALAALLGFSAACSSAKHSAGRSSEQTEAISVETRADTTHYRIIVMYGVRPPRKPIRMQQPDSAAREVPQEPQADTSAE